MPNADKETFKCNLVKLETWKMALHQVANLSGYHFKHGEEYEYKFIQRIVELVSKKINRAPLHVADYPVGLESRMQEVKELLDVGSDDKFVNLTSLSFDSSQHLTQMPDVSCIPHLENLSFMECDNLFAIHQSVGLLKKLRILDAEGCLMLKYFTPIKLTSLEQLKLGYCHSLESFPEILGKMENITDLDLRETPELHEAGRTCYLLPRAKIPEWFEFQTSEFPISFWFHNKLPAIAICHVIEQVAEFSSSRGWTSRPSIITNMIINGNANLFYSMDLGSDCSVLFDPQDDKVTDNLDEALLENE
ncbi:hypothetical protein JHK87_052533 [Glycine soja]|nr:hypothetical protein JHK87_052533 [Glycine soja]